MNALHQEGRHREALQLLDENFAPKEAMSWVWRGALLWWLDEFEQAEAAYREGLQDPALRLSAACIAADLARLLIDQQRYDEVLEVTSVGAARNDTLCLFYRFRAMIGLGRTNEVLQKLEKFAQASNSNPEPMITLLFALVCLGVGYQDRAQEVIRRLDNMVSAGFVLDSRWSAEFQQLRDKVRAETS